jgi:hypothetical protein
MDKINQEDLRYPEDIEANFIWNGDDLTVLLKEGSIILKNCWPQSVTFSGLDYSDTEEVTLTGLHYSEPIA